jgi:hypothetical protein
MYIPGRLIGRDREREGQLSSPRVRKRWVKVHERVLATRHNEFQKSERMDRPLRCPHACLVSGCVWAIGGHDRGLPTARLAVLHPGGE